MKRQQHPWKPNAREAEDENKLFAQKVFLFPALPRNAIFRYQEKKKKYPTPPVRAKKEKKEEAKERQMDGVREEAWCSRETISIERLKSSL
jgi:hypothetical protein